MQKGKGIMSRHGQHRAAKRTVSLLCAVGSAMGMGLPGSSPAPMTGQGDWRGFSHNSWMTLSGDEIRAHTNPTAGFKAYLHQSPEDPGKQDLCFSCVLSSIWCTLVIQRSFIQPKVSRSILKKGLFLLIHLDKNIKRQ